MLGDVLVNFFNSQQDLVAVDARVENVTIWHQDLKIASEDESKITSAGADSLGKRRSKKNRRRRRSQEQEEASAPSDPVDEIDTGAKIDVTTVFELANTPLPEVVTSFLLVHTCENFNSMLLQLLHDQKGFYTYYQHINAITVKRIEILTKVPTMRPTTFAEMLKVVKEEEYDDSEPKARNVLVVVGLGVTVVWCMLTLISLTYLRSQREAMRTSFLLKATFKATFTDNTADNEHRTSSVSRSSQISDVSNPVGEEEDEYEGDEYYEGEEGEYYDEEGEYYDEEGEYDEGEEGEYYEGEEDEYYEGEEEEYYDDEEGEYDGDDVKGHKNEKKGKGEKAGLFV